MVDVFKVTICHVAAIGRPIAASISRGTVGTAAATSTCSVRVVLLASRTSISTTGSHFRRSVSADRRIRKTSPTEVLRAGHRFRDIVRS